MEDYNEIINEALKDIKENVESFDQIAKKAFVQIIINDNELIEKILNCRNMNTKRTIAEYGTDEMRWKLIDDEDDWIRETVAEYGNKEICEILKNDKDEDVRRVAEERLRDLELFWGE